MNFIPFRDISIEAWKSSIAKWSNCLIINKDIWIPCSICKEVTNITESDDCYQCPLVISKFCTSWKDESKLSKMYIDETKSWEERVNDYLDWLGIEVEMWDAEILGW